MDSVPSVLSSESSNSPNDFEAFDVLEFDDEVSNSSPAGLVMFHGSKNTYLFGEEIQIKFYAFNHAYQMEDDHRVGIAPMKSTPFVSHKITNASPESCIDIISDDLIEENQITAKKISFKVDELPSEIANEKYFQFCYLNVDGQVMGYSIPFQFLHKQTASTSSSIADAKALQSSVMEIDVERSQSDDVHMERQEDDDFILVSLNFIKNLLSFY